MKRLLLSLCCLSAVNAHAWDYDMANKIRAEGFYNSHVMETMQHLTDTIGPRLTGSPQMTEANNWTKQQLQNWGLKNAHLDPFDFGRGWSFDAATIDMLGPRKMSMYGVPLAWTPGTNGPVSGEVMVFDAGTEAELERYKGKLRGKFLLIGEAKEISRPKEPVFVRMDSKKLNKLKEFDVNDHASHSLGITQDSIDKYRQRHYFELALAEFLKKEKPAGVIYRSRRQGGVIGTSSKNHRVGKTFPVPAITITQEHFNLMHRMLDLGQTPKVKLDITARFHDEDRNAYNTIAEIPGTDKDPQVVMLGAHLDSWHGSTGAVDNAAGVAVTMEAVRILKALNVKPKRTIRIALWSGEEQGLFGSRSYVEKNFATRPKPSDPEELAMSSYLWRTPGWPITPIKDYDKLSVYFNMDNGSGRFRGIYTEGNVAVKPIFGKWFAPYSDLSTGTITNKSNNFTDHEAFDDVGLPGFQFIQDPLDYRTRLHHSHLDSFDHVVEADLKQASVIMAAFVYNAATMDERMPRKPMPTEPAAHIKNKAQLKADKERRKREKEANKALDADNYKG